MLKKKGRYSRNSAASKSTNATRVNSPIPRWAAGKTDRAERALVILNTPGNFVSKESDRCHKCVVGGTPCIRLARYKHCARCTAGNNQCKPRRIIDSDASMDLTEEHSRDESMAIKTDAPMELTKAYVKEAFKPLEETFDLAKREVFFSNYIVPDVSWEVTGTEHAMAGTRHSVAEHNAASFARLRVKIRQPIKFVVRSILLDTEDRTTCVELFGYATKLDGEPYDNEYAWILHWNDEGKIDYVRSYHDTHLAEKLLYQEFVKDEHPTW